MCSSAVPINVLGRHVLDAYIFEMDGTPELDFVLCGPTVSAALADTTVNSSTSDQERIVDYSWLNSSTQPRFRPGDPLSARIRAIIRWIERSYTTKCTRELPEVLRVYSKTMSFEYDVYLGNLTGDDGRRVEGLVQLVGNSRVHITLSVPLLLNDGARVRRTLGNILELYAKTLQLRPYSNSNTNNDSNTLVFSRADLSLLIACGTSGREAPVEVLSERIAMHVEEADTLVAPFIHASVALRGLPQYAAAVKRGAAFMDYIPSLESAVLHTLREPLHFLSMVTAMSSFFGPPLSVDITVNDSDGGGDGARVRSAAFGVQDSATQCAFFIGVRYHTAWSLPSVGIIASQHMGGRSQESALRAKLQYSEELRRLEHNSSSSGEPLDIATVCEAVECAALEVMSFLLSTCQ